MSALAPETICKNTAEKVRARMNFSNRLAAGETLSSITSVTSEKVGGGTSDLTISDDTLDGDGQVSFWIEDGSVGRYEVTVTVVTSSTAVLVGEGILKVED